MTQFLSGQFAWLLPLALLPVIIHLLNRLRYQSVPWGAMMFLRLADRESTRRAKLRQWLILAMRTLMLLAILSALLRPVVRGALSRFFDTGADLVIILLDRSASMERGENGVSARNRALELVNQSMTGQSSHTRYVLLDSTTGEFLSLGTGGADLTGLPNTAPSDCAANMPDRLVQALNYIRNDEAVSAEVWIASDLQSSSWRLEAPDLLPETDDSVSIRLLSVPNTGQAGNASLQLAGNPLRSGEEVSIRLKLSGQPLPRVIEIERKGVRFRESITPEGDAFVWEKRYPVGKDETFTATFSIPADSSNFDNHVFVAMPPIGLKQAEVALRSPSLRSIATAGLLPIPGERIVEEVEEDLLPRQSTALRIQHLGSALGAGWDKWLDRGGVLLLLPEPGPNQDTNWQEEDMNENWAVADWEETVGPFRQGANQRPFRLDLLQVGHRVLLNEQADDIFASHVDGSPLLTREERGDGAVYRLSTLPLSGWSNLGAGYLWVPLMQRLLASGQSALMDQGTHNLLAIGDPFHAGGEWQHPLDLDPEVNAGLYQQGTKFLARNIPPSEFDTERYDLEEIKDALRPLQIEGFEASEGMENQSDRSEITPWFVLCGLLFLAAESILLLKAHRPAPDRQRHRRPTS